MLRVPESPGTKAELLALFQKTYPAFFLSVVSNHLAVTCTAGAERKLLESYSGGLGVRGPYLVRIRGATTLKPVFQARADLEAK